MAAFSPDPWAANQTFGQIQNPFTAPKTTGITTKNTTYKPTTTTPLRGVNDRDMDDPAQNPYWRSETYTYDQLADLIATGALVNDNGDVLTPEYFDITGAEQYAGTDTPVMTVYYNKRSGNYKALRWLVNIPPAEEARESEQTTPSPGLESPPKYLTYEEAVALGITNLDKKYEGTGIPLVKVYFDAEGNYDSSRGYTIIPQAATLYDLQNVEFPSFDSWSDENQDLGSWQNVSGVLGDLGGLAELLGNAGIVGSDQYNSDQAAQLEYAANQTGFGSAEEYIDWLNNYKNTNISDMEGFSAEQRNTYNRAFAQEMAIMREDYSKMVEAIGVQSTSRAFSAMDQATSQMTNMRLQREEMMINMEMAQRQLEYDALARRSEKIIDLHSQEKAFLADQMYQNRIGALNAYATSLNGMLQANSSLLQAYSADMQTIKFNADTMYNTIMAQIGLEESLLNQSAEEYEQSWAPYYAAKELELMEAADKANDVGVALKALGFIVGLGLILVGAPGIGIPLIGGAALGSAAPYYQEQVSV